MFERVDFLSRAAAQTTPGMPAAVLISLTDPGSPLPALHRGWCDVLRLQFFDADDEVAAAAEAEGLRVCRPEDAELIVAFLDRWHGVADGPSVALAHCEQGISRSAAVARFAAERYGLDFPWHYTSFNRRVHRLLHAAASPARAGSPR